MELPKPTLEHTCDLTIQLDNIRELGTGRAGKRRIIPIIGGSVTGAHITGKILNVGADWQTVFSSNLAELDTRYALETDDGATIEIKNYGFRHGPEEIMTAVAKGESVPADSYYMRTHARLETGDVRYDWVNNTLFLGVGARDKASVRLSLYAIR